MVRAAEPKKNKKPATTNENGASESNARTPQPAGIPDDVFDALFQEGIEKYDAIWKSLADK